MKKKMLVLFSCTLLTVFAVNAQGGGNFPRRTVEERTKAVMDKLADWKLDKDKSASVDSIFTNHFKAQDKARQDAMAGGGQPDREAMRATMQKMNAERDDKLKKVFTDEQFKKWKDEIEPSLRPQRPGGGGNNQ